MSVALRGPACARAVALACLAALAALAPACAGPDPDAGSGGGPVAAPASARDDADDEPIAAPAAPPARRGLGTVSARIPGTNEVVGGVSIVTHDVTVSVDGGFARTEIREEILNDGDRVLEGRYVFPLPPGASIGRLALWVGDELVEGEIVERTVASRIFRGIVDDTVRPRDPALLEWVSGSEVKLTVFPIPPHASRKVLLAYDERLPRRGAYVLPLSLGGDRATPLDAVSIDVAVARDGAPARDVATPGHDARVGEEGAATRVRFAARGFVPTRDFVVTFADPEATSPIDATYGALPGDREGFVAVRARAALAEGPTSRPPLDRAIVIDASQSQSPETLAAAARIAIALVRRLDPGDRAEIFACDSDCARFDGGGDRVSARALAGWLAALAPRGSSDLAGAVLAGARAFGPGDRRRQVVVIGDGAPSSGELSAASIAAHVRGAVAGVDLALLGVGRTVDEVVLGALARDLGGTYHRVATGAPIAERAAEIAASLDAPVVADAKLELPPGLVDAAPRALPNLRVGDEVVVYARRAGSLEGGAVALTGRVGDRAVRVERPLPPPGLDVVAVPRLWAEARLAELEADDSRDARAASIALSKRFHVMSRSTAWLVLENDRMFEAFGIPRTVRPRGDDRLGLVGPRLDPADAPAPGPVGDALVPARAAAPDPLGSSPKGGPAPAAAPRASAAIGGTGLSGAGQGFGSGQGRLGGAHRTKPPQIRMGATMVSGRLPPEIVQRIVRQNFGRFRACYERGLARNPDLGGRVTTRFVIDRSGAVVASHDAGSDLPDAEVVSCVVRSFGALAFPQPEGGVVSVVYPIVFSSDGTRPVVAPRLPSDTPSSMPATRPIPPSERPPVPSAVIAAGDEAWRAGGDAVIAKLAAAVADKPTVRARHEALVRGLLARGRVDDALAAARRFVELDPDRPIARELLAVAASAAGDPATAVRAIDELAEIAPDSAVAHARAARAFEAIGDERRACAHLRALGDLRKDAPAKDRDAALADALRCRARVLGERDVALAAARAAGDASPPLARLATALEGGLAPAWVPEGLPAGALEAQATCPDGPAACPSVVVVAPDGSALSPFAPSSRARSGRGAVAAPIVVDGVYRVLAVGAGTGTVTVRALGAQRTFPVDGRGVRTVATVVVRDAG